MDSKKRQLQILTCSISNQPEVPAIKFNVSSLDEAEDIARAIDVEKESNRSRIPFAQLKAREVVSVT